MNPWSACPRPRARVRPAPEGISRCSGRPDCQAASFAPAPLPGEPFRREDLHSFTPREARLKESDFFRYLPLGCPINCFAMVLKSKQGIVTVHQVGPVHLLQGLPTLKGIGLCLGGHLRGNGELRFLPELFRD